VKGQDCWY